MNWPLSFFVVPAVVDLIVLVGVIVLVTVFVDAYRPAKRPNLMRSPAITATV